VLEPEVDAVGAEERRRLERTEGRDFVREG
jgi:hypothetical protein